MKDDDWLGDQPAVSFQSKHEKLLSNKIMQLCAVYTCKIHTHSYKNALLFKLRL